MKAMRYLANIEEDSELHEHAAGVAILLAGEDARRSEENLENQVVVCVFFQFLAV
ncbi:hypothetical protein [Rhizobium sp. IBUN]|uniref:hypothetical protein n=1 Tax=Rhizobium sp. IBUN TaxID=1042326 RepID=UPI00041E4278|nr:hypothetical protein [Rhizobium sp. IBUN]